MANRPESLILVYDGESGLSALLLDVLKKAVGREDCALCEITNSPVGRRAEWKECVRSLGIPFSELHRDEVPTHWGVARADFPCVLARYAGTLPTVLVDRSEIASCRGDPAALEQRIRSALRPGEL